MNRFFLLISALLITQWSYSQIHEFGLMVGGSNFIGDVGSTSYIAPKNTAFGGVYKNQDKNFVKKLSKLIPIGRMAKPEEIANYIVYLISEENSFMTGQTISVSGGE